MKSSVVVQVQRLGQLTTLAMYKSHLHSALCRSRSNIDTVAISLRQFHVSAARSGAESTPLPRRVQRLQDTITEVEKLFAGTKEAGRAPRYSGVPLDARNLQADPSTAPPVTRNQASTNIRGGAHGGRGTTTSRIPRDMMANSSQDERRPLRIIRQSSGLESGPRATSTSASPARQLEHRPLRIIRAVDNNLRASTPSSAARFTQEREPGQRGAGPRQQRFGRDSSDGGNKSSRTQPRPRTKGKSSSSFSSFGDDDDTELSAAQLVKVRRKQADLQQAQDLKQGGEIPYEIPEVSIQALQGWGPAMARGQWGMSEMVGQRMEKVAARQGRRRWEEERLARLWITGECVKCESKEQKGNVARLVKKMIAADGAIGNLGAITGVEDSDADTHEPDEATLLTDEQKGSIVDELLGGKYVMGNPQATGLAAELARHTSRNESYLPKHGEALLKKIGMLVPAAQRMGGKAKGVGV